MPKISNDRKDQRRRQILDAAIGCFARHGFQQTTIQDICASSGLSAGAVYSYFDSKDAIIEAIAGHGRQLARQRSVRSGPASPGGLKAFLAEFERPAVAKVSQFDLRSWAEAIGNRQLRENYLRSRKETASALATVSAREAAALGVAPEILAELILAVIIGCETRRAIQPSADVMPVIDTLVKLLQMRQTDS
jgi:TetR/AcrR family transcriptional regulator, transcriptional repressor of aconitase